MPILGDRSVKSCPFASAAAATISCARRFHTTAPNTPGPSNPPAPRDAIAPTATATAGTTPTVTAGAADATAMDHVSSLRTALTFCLEAEQVKLEHLQRRQQQQQAAAAAATAAVVAATASSASVAAAAAAAAAGATASPPPSITPRSSSGQVGDKKHKFWRMVAFDQEKVLAMPLPPNSVPAGGAAPAPAAAGAVPGAAAARLATTGTTSPVPLSSLQAVAAAAGVVLPPGTAGIPPAPSSPGVRRGRLRSPPILHHNKYKQRVALELTAVMNANEDIGPLLLRKFSAENRRLLLVMATANELYGEDYERVVEQVQLEQQLVLLSLSLSSSLCFNPIFLDKLSQPRGEGGENDREKYTVIVGGITNSITTTAVS